MGFSAEILAFLSGIIKSFIKCIKYCSTKLLYGILVFLCILADTSRSDLSSTIQVSSSFFARILVLDVGLLVFDQGSDLINAIQMLIKGDYWWGCLCLLCVWLPGTLRAATILDLYLRDKLDLTRLGLSLDDSRRKVWMTLLRTFLVRIIFFPILPITQFLKSIFSKNFEKDYTFGVTDKYLESFAEASPQLLLNVYILLRTWEGSENVVLLCAITSSFLSVAKTAAEGQTMFLLKQVPPVSHWLPLFPYYALSTLTRCLTMVVLISYLKFLSLLPILLFFITGILTGHYAGKQQGMSCFNCGLSAFLSSAFFTTLKESSLYSSQFYLWNTICMFLISSTSISALCILITLGSPLISLKPGNIPAFSCYHPLPGQNLTNICDEQSHGYLPYCGRECHPEEHPHLTLLQVILPMLLGLWTFALIYSFLIKCGKICAFQEGYKGMNLPCVVSEEKAAEITEVEESKVNDIILYMNAETTEADACLQEFRKDDKISSLNDVSKEVSGEL